MKKRRHHFPKYKKRKSFRGKIAGLLLLGAAFLAASGRLTQPQREPVTSLPNATPGIHQCFNAITKQTVRFEAEDAVATKTKHGLVIAAIDLSSRQIVRMNSRQGWTCDWNYPSIGPDPKWASP